MKNILVVSFLIGIAIIVYANKHQIEISQEIEYPPQSSVLKNVEIEEFRNRHGNTPALHRAAIDAAIAIRHVQEAGIGDRDKRKSTVTLKKAIMCLSEQTTIPKKETKFIYQIMLPNEEETDKFLAGVVGKILENQSIGESYTCPIFTKEETEADASVSVLNELSN
ncbi:hypothetical protein F7U66_00560 [Vibrio parahaemolyticus]|nr:hypothetical protein [Vibrio parahaemolyticus]